ncbi:MAG TPA: sulfotransferase [Pseudomonadales bacterium]|nr:sulfotransferase [Pseudomonadales bacterium]HND28280.1 sulfotransferase [Pseudomonadales bacterium]
MTALTSADVPLLFHIGYHKTGTSWLQQLFFPGHPALVPLIDSAQPWNDPLMRALVAVSERSFDPVHARALLDARLLDARLLPGQVAVVSAERLSGHPYSGGYDSFAIARRLHAVAPQAKIVGLVREQRAMIRSVYKQMVAEGFTASLEEWLAMQPWKGTRGFDWTYYEYDKLVQHYQELFGREQTLFLPHEWLRRERSLFLAELCAFCGVAHQDEWPEQEVNSSLGAPGTALLRRLNRLRRSELNPDPCLVLPAVVTDNLRRGLRKVEQWLDANDIRLDAATEQKIIDYYRPANQRLAELLQWPDRYVIDWEKVR